MIMSGRLRPGEFIRPDALAEELGISVTPVREGLLSLRGEGFLLLEPRRGFTVAPLSASDIRDLFRGQALLAGELAARAATRIEPADLSELRSLQEALKEAAQQGVESDMESLNHSFHRLIHLRADAPKLAWTLSVSARYVPSRFYSTIEGWPQATLLEHSDILEALTRHDEATSRTAMAEHLDHAGSLLASHFEQMRTE
jgi:DNA-binding GntR family transcriptional regulator